MSLDTAETSEYSCMDETHSDAYVIITVYGGILFDTAILFHDMYDQAFSLDLMISHQCRIVKFHLIKMLDSHCTTGFSVVAAFLV